jgi:hypothetical protein
MLAVTEAQGHLHVKDCNVGSTYHLLIAYLPLCFLLCIILPVSTQ